MHFEVQSSVLPKVEPCRLGMGGGQDFKTPCRCFLNTSDSRDYPGKFQTDFHIFILDEDCNNLITISMRIWISLCFLDMPQGCGHVGHVQHEMLHALGFFHQHNRPDRDNYINIYWDHIKKGQEHNFRKQVAEAVDTRGQPYDVNSIMHYGSKYMGKRGWFGLGGKKTYVFTKVCEAFLPDYELRKRNSFGIEPWGISSKDLVQTG